MVIYMSDNAQYNIHEMMCYEESAGFILFAAELCTKRIKRNLKQRQPPNMLHMNLQTSTEIERCRRCPRLKPYNTGNGI